MTMQIHSWDTVIIGGGIAGLSAAQMLGRARRRTLLIDAGAPRNRFAAHMHGVLGHDGVDPAELLARGRREAETYGVVIETGVVITVRPERHLLRIERADGTVDTARTLIVASGLRDELPDVPGLAAHWGRGVAHCPYCHGFEVAGRRLGVLATGPGSVHQIELIRQWSDHVVAFVSAIDPITDDLRERLEARDIVIVTSPVTDVIGDIELSGVRTADGTLHPIDTLFTAPTPVIDLAFLNALDLPRTDQPGAPLLVDGIGATGHPRVWAAGNTVAAYGTVPVSMASGSMVGAAANAALVMDDIDIALHAARRSAEWEQHYTEREQVWSGKVNTSFASAIDGLSPGTALDVGCGEGGDALWLAEQGWTVTGVDVSHSAISRAGAAARERGLGPDRVRFEVGDAHRGLAEAQFDLVAASFLHSRDADFPRIDILREAGARVAPGGRLVVVSHVGHPPRAGEGHPAPTLLSPGEELDLLALDPQEWVVERADVVTRAVTAPDGRPAEVEDGILLLRRL